jgi:ribosomal protein L11 methyltransferase
LSAWEELRLEVAADLVDQASGLLWELGCSGVQEEALGEATPAQVWDAPRPEPAPAGPVLLRAWFEAADQGAVEARLRDALGAGLEVAWERSPEVDWTEAWKEGLEPVRVSPRLIVAPPWAEVEGEEARGAHVLRVEPGQGFGTGEHPTTRALLAAVDALADETLRAGDGTCLDVGCGSGVLAIAAAKLGLAARGVDHEPEAVDEARVNAAANGVAAAFTTTPAAELTAPADLVLANLHAEVLLDLAPHLLRLTQRWLVLGGILRDREAKVRAAFAELELERREVADDRWVCLWLRRGPGLQAR